MSSSARPAWPPRWWPGGLAWALWVLTLLGVAAAAWLDQLLRRAGLPELTWLGAGNAPSVGAAVSAATVGAVVASRRPRHPVGWLLLVMGLSVTLSAAGSGYRWYGLVARPGTLPATSYLAGLIDALVIFYVACAGFVLLLTPTGSLPSRRWRWWVWIVAAAAVVFVLGSVFNPFPGYPEYPDIRSPIGIAALAEPPLDAVVPASGAVVLVALVVAAGSLVGRFRRARGTERQQLRWLAWGAALAAVALVVAIADLAMHGGNSPLFQAAAGACLAMLPLATGAAILRYRLYDLDYIISRTVVYGLLTTAGVGVYIGVVKGAEWLVRERLGVGGSLLATAVIAVGFAPARDRLQRRVDRRLYGERHDPVRAVTRLGERLRGVPGGVSGGDVLAEVLQGVCETLRLPSASLRVDAGAEVASFGRPGAISESILLEHEGQRVGALVVGLRAGEQTLGVADRRVLELLAAPVAVAFHAVLLSQELQRSRERLVAAREEERRRLRRDLHDGLGPILTAVTLKADAARSALDAAPDRADGLLAELRGDAKQAIGDLRRVIYDLRPASLDELGLLGALRQQVDRFDRDGVATTLQAPAVLPPLPAAVEVAAYRIITEALTNVARHAHARQTTITLTVNNELCIEVCNDGITPTTGAEQGWQPGVGLGSMAERAAEVGGTLQAGPTPTGGRVQATLPLELA